MMAWDWVFIGSLVHLFIHEPMRTIVDLRINETLQTGIKNRTYRGAKVFIYF